MNQYTSEHLREAIKFIDDGCDIDHIQRDVPDVLIPYVRTSLAGTIEYLTQPEMHSNQFKAAAQVKQFLEGQSSDVLNLVDAQMALSTVSEDLYHVKEELEQELADRLKPKYTMER